MATDLTALQLNISAGVSGSVGKAIDLTSVSAPLAMSKVLALAFGTGAGKANQVWHDRRVLAGGADESTNIDLAGTLTNFAGVAVTFANVKAIVVFNRSDEEITDFQAVATDAAISVGDTAANEFQGPFHAAGDAITIPAGGAFLVTNPTAAGWSVSAGDGDILLISNEDADDQACYDIFIVGESA